MARSYWLRRALGKALMSDKWPSFLIITQFSPFLKCEINHFYWWFSQINSINSAGTAHEFLISRDLLIILRYAILNDFLFTQKFSHIYYQLIFKVLLLLFTATSFYSVWSRQAMNINWTSEKVWSMWRCYDAVRMKEVLKYLEPRGVY